MKYILLIFAIFCGLITAKAQNFYQNGQAADYLISGADFNKTKGANVFNHPASVSANNGVIAITDKFNNRLLVWKSIPNYNKIPDLVLGQANFDANNTGENLSSLNSPSQVCVTPQGKLLIADTENDRILVWLSIPTENGKAADFEIKVSEYSTPNFNFAKPMGVWSNDNKLIITTSIGAGILVWNSFPNNQTAPSFIIEAANFDINSPRDIISDGAYLSIGDNYENSLKTKNYTLIWHTFPIDANSAPNTFLESVANSSSSWINYLHHSSGKYFLADDKISIMQNYSDVFIPNASTYTLDWNNYKAGNFPSLATDNKHIFINSYEGNLVFVYDSIPTNTQKDAPPHFAFGANSINENAFSKNSYINNPYPLANEDNLFVLSDVDKRLYIYKQKPKTSGVRFDTIISFNSSPIAAALKDTNLVLATADNTIHIWDSLPLNGESADRTVASIGNVVFGQISGIAFDNTYFYVSDYQNNMIYVWQGLPIDGTENPIYQFNVNKPMQIFSDGNVLTVCRTQNNEIKFYVVQMINNFAQPIKTLQNTQESNWLDKPQFAFTKGSHTFISNTGKNQVIAWQNLLEVGDLRKAVVLGQDTLIDTKAGISANRLTMPSNMYFDGVHLWVGETKNSNRLLAYEMPGAIPNNIPIFAEQNDTTVNVSKYFEITLLAVDTDLEPITYSFNKLPIWISSKDTTVSILKAKKIFGIANNQTPAFNEIEIVAHDGNENGYDTLRFVINVTGQVQYISPKFREYSDTTLKARLSYQQIIWADDENGDVVDYKVLDLPDFLTYKKVNITNAMAAELSGTPSNANIGKHLVRLVANDPGNLSDTLEFYITIEKNNMPPTNFKPTFPKNFDSTLVVSDFTLQNFEWEKSADQDGDPINYILNVKMPNKDVLFRTTLNIFVNQMMISTDFSKSALAEWWVKAYDNIDSTESQHFFLTFYKKDDSSVEMEKSTNSDISISSISENYYQVNLLSNAIISNIKIINYAGHTFENKNFDIIDFNSLPVGVYYLRIEYLLNQEVKYFDSKILKY